MKLRKCFGFGLAFGLACSFASYGVAQTSAELPNNANTPPPKTPVETSTSPRLDSLPSPKKFPVPPGDYVSSWLMDVVKLVKAGIDDSVIVTFIDSAGTFSLDAEKIIYLRDLGLSGEMTAIMLQHDAEIVAGLRPTPAAPSASSPVLPFQFSHSADSSPSPVPTITAPRPSAPPNIAKTEKPVDSAPETIAVPQQQLSGIQVAPPSDQDEFADDFPPAPPSASPLPQTISPVRQPYAVKLLDPIVMVRAPGRVPNITVIEFAR